MKYTDFKEGEIVKYQGHIGRVFALAENVTPKNILIEFDKKTPFSWSTTNPGTLPKNRTLNRDKHYYYPVLEQVRVGERREEMYEIY